MTCNPMEECPPEEVVTSMTIQCELVHMEPRTKRRGSGPRWRVRIPELQYEIHTANLAETLSSELGRIEEFNEELIAGDQAWLNNQLVADLARNRDTSRAATRRQLMGAYRPTKKED